ncbi:glycerophosphodiester phosphodiesterase GDPD2-like [Rosa rugosa]|uniref:glycerophosphodiester phosphodiesterase GDPD2-like n=1 Tax=Rosa rugosa TaxID=74645 RepID=UPI002B4094DA|nr:glycerophosphodiester phosphodiesterase GDPD2-like [Rosa rugosa]
MLQSSDIIMRGIKGNSILSFNTAAQFPIDFVEFDVQVTKDDCPVIFHDSFIVSEDKVISCVEFGFKMFSLRRELQTLSYQNFFPIDPGNSLERSSSMLICLFSY